MGKIDVRTFDIEGPALITPKRFGDARGYFCETWSDADWRAADLPSVQWVQDNEALSSTRGTVRGLHFQAPPSAQAKLLRAIRGEIFDVAVDIRKGSATYGKSVSAILTSSGGEQLFVPRGFVHGYQTLTSDTLVAYKCDGAYDPSAEGGLLWSDDDLDFDWPITDGAILADRDMTWPRLQQLDSPFQH
ncbi:MAG: dTDP-4-dehydrorhamnose 3,5-epimerase [Pseudomonadota bacterium]